MAAKHLDGKAIARRIAQIMQEMGFTQLALAEALGLSQPAVSQYLHGRIPPPEVLVALSRLAGRSVDWILLGEEASAPEIRVSEARAPYGQEALLLEAYRMLPPELKQTILRLCQQIARRVHPAADQ